MKMYNDEDFLLSNPTAGALYHRYAENLPIIDYHCHLSPQQIAEDHMFSSITELWLSGDHYKWRLMRANGVGEKYVTGNADDRDKFMKWAAVLPYAFRNPIYHWTHLELKRVFGITEILKPETAGRIYDQCNEMLSDRSFSARELMKRFNVETVCTTDDPADSLESHKKIRESGFSVKVLPTWRPDRLLATGDPAAFRSYVQSLSEASGIGVSSFDDLMDALKNRHDFFGSMGCRLSDHGLASFPYEDFTEKDLGRIFSSLMSGRSVTPEDGAVFSSGVLHLLSVMDAESGWTQQFHLGPLRDCRSALFSSFGKDAGCDAVGDFPQASAGHLFLDRLDREGHLAKTILYNLNPKDSEALAVMAGTFNDGTVPGKVQYGAAWWFLDNEDGIRQQLDTVSRQGLLGRFVGMLTDSRSFVSYPRHEYFRRILCDVIGKDVESGRIPSSETEDLRRTVEGICYRNAKEYFKF